MLAHQLGGCLGTHAFHTGNVVDRIAGQGEHIGNTPGWHAPLFFHLQRTEQSETIFRIFEVRLVCGVNTHAFADQRVDILVVCGDHDLGLSAAGRGCVGGDEVVRFVARQTDIMHTQCFYRFLDDGKLPREVIRGLIALLFVGRQKLHPPFRQARIPNHGGRVRFDVGQHLPQGLEETEHRIGRLPARVGQVADGEK